MPCSPALAASIAAFNAKRFVCSAIPLIVFVILFIELNFSDKFTIPSFKFSALFKLASIFSLILLISSIDSEFLLLTKSLIFNNSLDIPSILTIPSARLFNSSTILIISLACSLIPSVSAASFCNLFIGLTIKVKPKYPIIIVIITETTKILIEVFKRILILFKCWLSGIAITYIQSIPSIVL